MKRFWIFFLAFALLLSACAAAATPTPAATAVPPTEKALPPTATAAPRTLTVFAAASLTGSFGEIGKAFEAANPGVTVTFNLAGTQALATQLTQGAQADVFASANHTYMDNMVKANLVAAGYKDFVTNVLEVILPANNPANVQTLQDLAKPGLKLVLEDKSVPAGAYSLTILDNLSKDAAYGADFKTRVLANLVSNETDVKQVVAKVQLGEADAGIVYVTDAIAAPTLKTIIIPANFNVIAKYPIAALTNAPQPELAAAFVAYVLSPDGQATMQKWGFMPVTPQIEDLLRGIFKQLSIANNPGWVFILPSLGLVLLLGLPLVALVWRAIGQDFFQYALSPTALSALKLSLLTSTVTVLVAIVTGTPLAYILARWKFRGKTAFELLIDLPVVLPPSVAGLALLIAFGRTGVFGIWLNAIGISLPFTTTAVVMAQTFVSAPLFVGAARVGFAEISEQILESALVEGANDWQVFRFIMAPLAGRALLAGLILTWTRALGEFGATILFAGNLQGKTQTMPLAIYIGFETQLGIGIALSVMLMVVSIVLLGVMRRLERRSKEETHPE